MKKLFLIFAFLPLFISGQTLNLNNNQVKLGGDTAVVVDGNLKADTVFANYFKSTILVFVGLLNQSDTLAPTLTTLTNTIGEIHTTYLQEGNFYLSIPYTEKNVVVFIGDVGNRIITAQYLLDGESIEIITKNSSGVGVNNVLVSTPIEIRVYP